MAVKKTQRLNKQDPETLTEHVRRKYHRPGNGVLQTEAETKRRLAAFALAAVTSHDFRSGNTTSARLRQSPLGQTVQK